MTGTTSEISAAGERALALLDAVVAAGGGSPREGQQELTAAVAGALDSRTHLVAQAPTGIGKTYAFGAAAATWLAARTGAKAPAPDPGEEEPSRPRVVITTATKALQDQLVAKDLPAVCGVLAKSGGARLQFSVLKGRGAYACLAKIAAIGDDHQEGLFAKPAIEQVIDWARDETATGDRDELPSAVADRDWSEVSATGGECPGASKCDFGSTCFAELAKRRAETADIVVVNTHLYASHLLADQQVLPAHDVVVVDEAHTLADTMVSCARVTISPGRLRQAAKSVGRAAVEDTAMDQMADRLQLELRQAETGRIHDLAGHALAEVLADLKVALAAAKADLAHVTGPKRSQADRAGAMVESLAGDLALLVASGNRTVCWIDDFGDTISAAPVSAAGLAPAILWPERTVIACSATICVGRDRESGAPSFAAFLDALGAAGGKVERLDTLAVGSPFDFKAQGLLVVPTADVRHDRRSPEFAGEVHDAMERLVLAADGRMLSLFTSKKAAVDAGNELRERLDGSGIAVTTQWEASQKVLLDRLRNERRLLICATQGWFQGIDVPGDALVVVTIDKLPFPRPDDPVWQARREAAGTASFARVDVPRAAMLLAQGSGRLIRTVDDRGVVVVFDSRLADRSRSYQRTIVETLPAFRRSVRIDDAVTFLADC